MKILFRLTVLIIAGIAVALVATCILGIPINIFGRSVDPSMFITVISSMVAAYFYWQNESSPHRLAAAYLDFLENQGIEVKRPWSVVLLLRAARHAFSVTPDVRFDLLLALGIEAFSPRAGPDARNLTLVSIAVFAPGESGLRARACLRASRDDGAVRLVFAYLDLSWDLAAKVSDEDVRELKLSELPQLAGNRIKLRSGELAKKAAHDEAEIEGLRRRFDLELVEIRNILKKGRWPRSLAEILRAMYHPKGASRVAVELLDFLNKRPWLRAALQRLFERLPAAAIERYLASRQFNAYLLSFVTPDKGHIAEPLKVLADPTRWTGENRYLLEQYTNNARIGLVPRELDFEQFAARLQSDLPKAIEIATTVAPEGGEMILHRLGLSGRDYYNVDIPGINERQAIARLRELLARGIEPSDLLSVLELARKPGQLLDDMIDCPLEDLAGPLFPGEEVRLKAVSAQLRKALLGGLNEPSAANLAVRLGQSGVLIHDIETAAKALFTILALQKYPWTLGRTREIVLSYLETLQNLVALKG